MIGIHVQQLEEGFGGRLEPALLKSQQPLLEIQVRVDLLLIVGARRTCRRRGAGEGELLVGLGQQALQAIRPGELDAQLGLARAQLHPVVERRQGIVEPAGVDVGGAQAEIWLDHLRFRAEHAFQLTNRIVALAEVEEREGQVVACLCERFVCLECLSRELDRALRVLQLPFGLAEQRQELRPVGDLLESRLQLVARLGRPAHLEIEIGEIEAGRHVVGVEREGLFELGLRFAHHVRRPGGPVGEAQEHVAFRRVRIGGKDLLELADRVLDAVRTGEDLRANPVEPLARRGVRLRGRRRGATARVPAGRRTRRCRRAESRRGSNGNT